MCGLKETAILAYDQRQDHLAKYVFKALKISKVK